MKKYKTWFDLEEGKLKTWDDFCYGRIEFFRKKKHNKLIFLGELEANQCPYYQDDIGIYRILYNKKKYKIIFSELCNIKFVKDKTTASFEKIHKNLKKNGFILIYPYIPKYDYTGKGKDIYYFMGKKPFLEPYNVAFESSFYLTHDIVIFVKLFRWKGEEIEKKYGHQIITSIIIDINFIYCDDMVLQYQYQKIDYQFKSLEELFTDIKNDFMKNIIYENEISEIK